MWDTKANCENIWGFMYCLHGTAVWKLKPRSVWLPLLSQRGGTQVEKGGYWEEEPVHKHSSLPAKLTNSDRQLTHSSKQRPMSGLRLWQEAAHPPVYAQGLLEMFLILMWVAIGHIPPAVLKWFLFPCLMKVPLLCYICMCHLPIQISLLIREKLTTVSYRFSGFNLISTVDSLRSLGHFTLVYFGRHQTDLILTWVQMCHTLISSYN